MTIRRVSATLALMVVIAAGCRGDLGPPLATWRARADEICKSVQEEADKTRPVLFEQSLAQTLRRSAEYSRTEARQLRELDKPSEQRDKVRDYLASLDDRTRELELLAGQAENPGSDFKPPSLDSLASHTQKTTTLATELGMQSCRAGVDVSVGGATAGAPSTTPTTAGADPNAPAFEPPPGASNEFETEDQLG